jgi:acyl carrier protein
MKQLSMWLALTSVIAASLACAVPFGIRTIKGSGNVVTEERAVSGFDSVALSAFGEVIITQGDEESLTIETDDNLMPYIQTEVRNRTLELGFTDDLRRRILVPSQSLVFRVSVIELAALNSSGAGRFEIDELDADRLEVTLSGAGDIGIDSLTASDLVVTVSGAGNIELAGQVKTQEVNLNALGNYVAPDLESQAATVRISGAGSASIWVHDTLDVTISGAGNVDYYGSPEVSKNISGVGKVTSQGDR